MNSALAQKTKTYHYKAISKSGVVTKGRSSATSKKALYLKLAEKNLSLVHCRSTLNLSHVKLFSRSKVSTQELLDFCMHMQYMDQAGVPLIDSLIDARENQPKLAWVIEDLIDQIRKGAMLSQAMSSHPRIFPDIFVKIINLSEESGGLAGGFEKLHDHLKWQDTFRKELIQSIRYPLIVLGLSFVLIWILSTWVVPQLQDLMTMSGASIPASSRILLKTTEVFSYATPFFLIALVFLFLLAHTLRFLSQSYDFFVNKMLLKIPFFGDILLTRDTTMFIHFLQVSLASGIDLLEALDYSMGSVKNSWLHNRLRLLYSDIKEGKTLSEAFKDTNIFDTSTIRLIQVGEITGQLQPLLINLEGYQMKRYKGRMSKFLSFIQPIIFALAGILLLWVVVSAFYPMYDFVLDMTG